MHIAQMKEKKCLLGGGDGGGEQSSSSLSTAVLELKIKTIRSRNYQITERALIASRYFLTAAAVVTAA